MFKNYLKISLRQLMANKAFTIINSIGLALSMSVCMIIIMLYFDQKNVDAYNPDRSVIYRLNTVSKTSDSPINRYATTPTVVGDYLRENIPGLENITKIRKGLGNGWISFDQVENIPLGGFFVTPEFLDLFNYKLKVGNPNTALKDPNNIIITEAAAIKLFGNENPMDKTVKIGAQGDFKITGVIENNNERSHIKFEALASFSSLDLLSKADPTMGNNNSWGNIWPGYVYFKAPENTDLNNIMAMINKEAGIQYADNEELDCEFIIQPLSEITPGPLLANEIGPVMPVYFLYFFIGLGVIIISTASFNYMNLSIAKALKRAKEVGVRKVNGASRVQIFAQFLMESVVLSLVALVVGYLLIYLLKPAFISLNFSRMLYWDLSGSPETHITIILFAILVGLLSGLVPAMILSSFNPLTIMKSASGLRLMKGIGFRKFLTVLQFTFAIVFIISSLIVNDQLSSWLGRDLGFKTENIINVYVPEGYKYEKFKAEIEPLAAVVNITGGSHLPGIGNSRGNDLFESASLEEKNNMNAFTVDHNYLNMLDIAILEGRSFNRDANPGSEILVNEKAVTSLGFDSPSQIIGKTYFDSDTLQKTVVGVVEDYHYVGFMMEINPLFIDYDPNGINLMHIQVNNDNFDEAIAGISGVYSKVTDNYKMNYKTFRDEIDNYYDLMFGDASNIIAFITILSVIISCLGLLGIATYTVETRLKEVSIRKILGAGNKRLIFDLSRGFTVLILISIILSVPIAWVLNNFWLEKMAYHITPGVGVMIAGVLTIVAFAALTILSQTYRAGKVAPVEHLRE